MHNKRFGDDTSILRSPTSLQKNALKKFYPLPSGKIAHLKGFIDRVDEYDDRTRIIDYKTGKGLLSWFGFRPV